MQETAARLHAKSLGRLLHFHSTTNLKTMKRGTALNQLEVRSKPTGWTATWTCHEHSETSPSKWMGPWRKTSRWSSPSLKCWVQRLRMWNKLFWHATASRIVSAMRNLWSGSVIRSRNSTQANSSILPNSTKPNPTLIRPTTRVKSKNSNLLKKTKAKKEKPNKPWAVLLKSFWIVLWPKTLLKAKERTIWHVYSSESNLNDKLI